MPTEPTGPTATPIPTPPPSSRQLAVGDRFAARSLRRIDGASIKVPGDTDLVHLQLRRFAGCPVCNLHLRSVVRRRDEIAGAGIHEVVVFHSGADELRRYASDLPLDTVADPRRALYVELGVERSIRALANPRLWRHLPRVAAGAVRNVLRGRGLSPMRPSGGQLGLPADILISPDGRVVAIKYGTQAYDQWSVDELLDHARQAIGARR